MQRTHQAPKIRRRNLVLLSSLGVTSGHCCTLCVLSLTSETELYRLMVAKSVNFSGHRYIPRGGPSPGGACFLPAQRVALFSENTVAAGADSRNEKNEFKPAFWH